MSEPFNIDNLLATMKQLDALGRDIPIGVRLHPADFGMLVRECTAPANPHALVNLPVYMDATVSRGTPKWMYRDDHHPTPKERGE